MSRATLGQGHAAATMFLVFKDESRNPTPPRSGRIRRRALRGADPYSARKARCTARGARAITSR
jgi:hypothetical protein